MFSRLFEKLWNVNKNPEVFSISIIFKKISKFAKIDSRWKVHDLGSSVLQHYQWNAL